MNKEDNDLKKAYEEYGKKTFYALGDDEKFDFIIEIPDNIDKIEYATRLVNDEEDEYYECFVLYELEQPKLPTIDNLDMNYILETILFENEEHWTDLGDWDKGLTEFVDLDKLKLKIKQEIHDQIVLKSYLGEKWLCPVETYELAKRY